MPELEPSSPPAPPTPPAPSPSPAPPGPDYRSGATIQPLSSWWYDAPTATSILLRELTDQSLRYLHNRSSAVSKLNETDVQGWSARIAQAQSNLGKVFAPLPPKSRNMRPMYKIVEVLTRPTYTCTKIMYQTRPGFHVPAALWKPANASVAKKAPGVLLVSGHTPDGFRSNNLFGDVKDNAPGDDDYEVVQINLVVRTTRAVCVCVCVCVCACVCVCVSLSLPFVRYDDFLIHFRGMDLVDRTTGFRDISLEFNEARGCLGPLWGCTLGCLSYWFLLEGCRSTCLGHTGDLHGMDRAAGKCKAQDEGRKYAPGESSEA